MDTTLEVGVSRRRIIKRPRLTSMLDESGARIILLVAPAGYGKTTLAREWLDERRAAWYRGGAASADVAALAVGLATAAAEIVPGAGDRMRQRLRATDRPEEDARILAEMLAEDLARWPEDAWLAIDDYHHAMEASAAEDFVGTVVALAPVRLLVSARKRPNWARARLRLYGHIFELDRTILAMSESEALDVLSQRKDAATLIGQAAGWPAVIGLAALAIESIVPPGDVPAALYDYFAEELLQEVDPEARRALCQLAVVPSITKDTATDLLGEDSARRLLADSVSAGILRPQSDDHYELHPLLQTFLQDRLYEFGSEMVASTVNQIGVFLLTHRLWDDALSLAQEFREPALLEALVESSWEAMLDEGRLATLARLVDIAAELRLRSSLFDLVEAEIAFRQAEYRKAETLALEAARGLRDEHFLVRAYSRAGQSAHFEGREEAAIDHHCLAHAIAQRKSDQREALWGEFVCAIELEDRDCAEVLSRLESLGSDEVKDAVRVDTGHMLAAIRDGSGFDTNLFSAIHRLPRVEDPLIRSSFLHVWSTVLTFTGRYSKALEAVDQLLRETEQYRLDFVFPHAYIRRAVALRGLRRFHEALEYLDRAQDGREGVDDYLAVATRSVRMGVHLVMGSPDAALRISGPALPSSVPVSALAEFIAIQALALACADRADEAKARASQARSLSSAAEPRLLATLAETVVELTGTSPVAEKMVSEMFQAAIGSENIDALVTAYRAFPQLLAAIASDEQRRAHLQLILANSDDLRFARTVLPAAHIESAHSVLTAREWEVLNLVAGGLRNQEIGQKLFISEVTVKSHMRNIMGKLGARSRTHAVSLANDLIRPH